MTSVLVQPEGGGGQEDRFQFLMGPPIRMTNENI
jgi:hypothetical protein